jgi:hypothetical protein
MFLIINCLILRYKEENNLFVYYGSIEIWNVLNTFFSPWIVEIVHCMANNVFLLNAGAYTQGDLMTVISLQLADILTFSYEFLFIEV